MVDYTVALGKLWDLFVEEANFLSSVGDHVDEVRGQLYTMQFFLKDVDKRKDRDNPNVSKWIADFRELSIQADDALEMYVIKVMSRRQGVNLENILERFTCILGECTSILGKCLSMHQIGNEIDGIRSCMADLVRRAESLAKGESSSSPMDNQIEWSRRTYDFGVEENFIGMKEDIKRLSFLVRSDEREHRVISLCGMGGLGKTTLAKRIYQDEVVQRCYKARAWVCLSQQFQPRYVFQEVLKQLLGSEGQECQNLSENELVRKLYKVQMEKKCLVVLDDIWTVCHWNILKRGFPYTETACKVLLTSRNANIITEYNYKLQCLSKDEGWELLERIALPTHRVQELCTTDSKRFEEMGREIVSKCGCLPLAISVIGGILCQEINLSEWEKVRRNLNSYLQRGKGVEGDERVNQVLDLSYYALPYYLKPCFLYLGCFREDEDINTEWLYELWIAEGMISSQDRDRGRGEVLRDVAERYLWELASRCMVQVEMDEESAHNRFKSCRLHDLMRELCLSKGREEKFLKVVDKQEGGQDVSSIEGTPRLACYWDDVQDNIGGNPNLRSLLVRSKWLDDGAERHPSIDFGMFKRLKILIFVGFKFKNRKLPKGIEKLILLKHLRIESCVVDALPPSLFNLPCLQSLAMRDTRGTVNLPDSLCNMRRLRYLRLPWNRTIIGGEKLKLDGLSELETLIRFDSETDDVTHLPKLKNLRILEAGIDDDESLSIIVDYVWNHQDQLHETRFIIWHGCNINSQEGSTLFDKLLMCKSLNKLKIRCRLRKLSIPEPQRCRNLLSLDLSGCEIEEDPMEILGKLPMLRTLRLYYGTFVGEKLICRAAGFPQLRALTFEHSPNLVEWRVEEKAMPQLSEFSISNCDKLEMIPDGLKFITALKEIRIDCMPKQFVDRVQVVDGKAGADWDKIKHVPSIRIGWINNYSTDMGF